jgi:hypothetical protein
MIIRLRDRLYLRRIFINESQLAFLDDLMWETGISEGFADGGRLSNVAI